MAPRMTTENFYYRAVALNVSFRRHYEDFIQNFIQAISDFIKLDYMLITTTGMIVKIPIN